MNSMLLYLLMFLETIFQILAIVKSITKSRGELRRFLILQKQLLKLGYKLPKYGADGDFGSETKKAVKAFQTDKGLQVDGIVGPKTWAALDSAIK